MNVKEKIMAAGNWIANCLPTLEKKWFFKSTEEVKPKTNKAVLIGFIIGLIYMIVLLILGSSDGGASEKDMLIVEICAFSLYTLVLLFVIRKNIALCSSLLSKILYVVFTYILGIIAMVVGMLVIIAGLMVLMLLLCAVAAVVMFIMAAKIILARLFPRRYSDDDKDKRSWF